MMGVVMEFGISDSRRQSDLTNECLWNLIAVFYARPSNLKCGVSQISFLL